MRMTTKCLVAVMLLTFCSVVSAQESFKELINASSAKRRVKDYDAAMKLAEKALAISQDNAQKAQAYTMMANVQNNLKQPEKAIELLDTAEALADLPTSSLTSIYWTKGAIFYSTQQYDKARANYEKLSGLDGANVTLRMRSVMASANTHIYSDPNNLPEAKKILAAVKDLPYAKDSDKAEAIYVLSLIDRLEKKYDDANEKIQSILDTPGISVNVKAKYKIAIADNYRMANQLEKAFEAYKAMVDDATNSPYIRSRSQMMIGVTYLQTGDKAKAIEAYQAVIDMKDGYAPYVKRAQDTIDRIKK